MTDSEYRPDTPKVSILILTMNHERFIAQACQSALDQTYPNIEIILLDNASSDETFEIAENTLTQTKIAYEVFKNSESHGVAKNLNFLVSKSSGTYVAILSGDDWWSPEMVSRKVAYALESSADFVLSDGFKYYQEETTLKPAYREKDKQRVIESLEDFFRENVTLNKTVNVGTFVKQRILVEYPFDEDIQTEDWDMNLRLSFLGFKLGFIDEKLFYYRILPSSLSRNWVVMEESYRKVTTKYLDFINADPLLKREYAVNLLHFKYEILLSKSKNDVERKKIARNWKEEKYRIKYPQALLFFKLLALKLK